MANPLQTVNNQIQAKCVELGDKAIILINVQLFWLGQSFFIQ